MVLYIAVGVLGALTVPQSHEVRHFYGASNRRQLRASLTHRRLSLCPPMAFACQTKGQIIANRHMRE